MKSDKKEKAWRTQIENKTKAEKKEEKKEEKTANAVETDQPKKRRSYTRATETETETLFHKQLFVSISPLPFGSPTPNKKRKKEGREITEAQ